MGPLEKMTDNELINTTQDDYLDYDIRIEASKEYLKRKGVIEDGTRLHQSNERNI